MKTPFKYALVATSVAAILVTPNVVLADDKKNNDEVNIVKIIGSRKAAQHVAGSAHVVTEAELAEMKYTDATRALQQIPGVYIQQEDGLGLRPNIAMRGIPTERSGKVSLMEDGVLIAPAPYSASSAYYFPTFDRITGIEVLKGAAATKYGPFTVGGAINFVSRSIPVDEQGSLSLEMGSDAQRRAHVFYGDSMENFGYLLEANQHQTDGFKTIDNANHGTGFDKTDYMAKFSFNSDADAAIYQQFDIKLQKSSEDSDQTYLGLTESDYAENPYRQYGVTQLDNFDGEHEQIMLSYFADISDDFDIRINAYQNETKRNWFKLAKLDDESLSTVINAINDPLSYAEIDANALNAVLQGADSAAGALTIRDNNRAYLSEGIQVELEWYFDAGSVEHEVQVGLRYHTDEEDRFQRDGQYTQINGQVVVDDAGVWGNAGNRIQSATAKSYFITDTISAGDWVFTPGVRFEDIELKRENWATEIRNGIAPTVRENSVSEVLPGAGALYKVTSTTSVLFGVNKGFAPPGNNTGDKPEESWNYEAGVRFNGASYSSELIVFYNDFDNILGECTDSSGGCDLDNLGDKTNGGRAKTQGVELMIRGDFAENWPARLSYTYTDTEFKETFNSDSWGPVEFGDAIPYIPENQAQFAMGYDNKVWNIYGSINYVDQVCTKAACTQFQKTDSLLVVDLSAEYQVNDMTTLYATLDNLFEEDGIAARQPYGARPVKARSAKVGVKFDF